MTGGHWELNPRIFIIWSTINPGRELLLADSWEFIFYCEWIICTNVLDINILFMIQINKFAWKKFFILHHTFYDYYYISISRNWAFQMILIFNIYLNGIIVVLSTLGNQEPIPFTLHFELQLHSNYYDNESFQEFESFWLKLLLLILWSLNGRLIPFMKLSPTPRN